MPLERPRPLGELLRDSIDEERVDRLRAAIAARRRAPKPAVSPRVAGIAVAASVALVAAAGVIVVQRVRTAPDATRQAGPIRLADGKALGRLATEQTAAAARRFDLADGSSIDLSPGASVTARENTGQRVTLQLGQGRATFAVTPGGPRQWRIEAGLAAVEVLGTIFTVERSSHRVAVAVRRGSVRVISDRLEGGSREVAAGDRLEVAEEEPEEARPELVPEPTGDGGGAEIDASAEDTSWLVLAHQGEFERAYEALGPAGVQGAMARAGSMETLLSLADVARLSGHAAEAVAPLERAIQRFSGDRRAAVAAFTLGRVESDTLGRHERAARAFARCLELGPPRALAEDAYARLAEAHARSGNYEGARAAASEYLGRYPDGRRAAELREWVEPR
jgi:transmembrane sensor